MESLNKKILLEFLEDEVEDIPEDEIENINISDLDVENPIAKTLCPTFTIDTLNSLLTDTQSIFNYLNTYVQDGLNTDPNGTNILDQISEEDKELIKGIYTDIGTIVGKIQQAIKDRLPKDGKEAIDNGANETIETSEEKEEDELTESIDNKEKEKFINYLLNNVDMGDHFDEFNSHEDEVIQAFIKNTKEELKNWKEYFRENEEVLNKIKEFENKLK